MPHPFWQQEVKLLPKRLGRKLRYKYTSYILIYLLGLLVAITEIIYGDGLAILTGTLKFRDATSELTEPVVAGIKKVSRQITI